MPGRRLLLPPLHRQRADMNVPTPREAKILDTIARCRDLLPAEQIRDMTELVLAGEPGIALENLATQLCEYEVDVSSEIVRDIEGLGSEMGLDEKYWCRLKGN